MPGCIHDAFAAAIENHQRDPKEPAPAIFKTVISTDYLRGDEHSLGTRRRIHSRRHGSGRAAGGIDYGSDPTEVPATACPLEKHLKR